MSTEYIEKKHCISAHQLVLCTFVIQKENLCSCKEANVCLSLTGVVWGVQKITNLFFKARCFAIFCLEG